MSRPTYFTDEMVKGAFRSFRHEHIFCEKGDCTVMKDVFNFEAPFGVLGRLVSVLVLRRYMKSLLTERNRVIRAYAESGKWHELF